MNQSIEKRDTFYLYRKELIRLIGKTKIFKLQQSLPLVDAFLCFLIISAFLINGFFLATLLIGIVWLALFILQGFIIQWFPFFAHDAFIHRKVGGKNIAYIGSILFMLPVFISPTAYREKHLKHHFYLNTAKDTEEYKLDLNSRWKKLFFLTFLGLNIITSRFLPNKNNQNPIQVEEIDTNKTIEINKRINNEKIILIFFCLAITLLCLVFNSQWVIYGYVLPLIILPIANLFRILLEHGDVDTNNPLQCGTYYKCGIFMKVLLFYNAGEYHFVHHLFPNTPVYKIPLLIKEIEPYLMRKNIRVQRSFIKILYSFLIKDKNLRTPWH